MNMLDITKDSMVRHKTAFNNNTIWIINAVLTSARIFSSKVVRVILSKDFVKAINLNIKGILQKTGLL